MAITNQSPAISNSGIVRYTSKQYSYIISVSGSNYQVLYGSNSSLIYQSTTSATAWNYLLGTSGIASAGSTVNVLAGAYTITASWTVYKSNVQITFNSGAVMTMAAHTPSAMMEIHANGVIINGGEFDGNAANQDPSPTTFLIGTPWGSYWTHQNGILIYGSNCLVEYATVHDCRYCGIVAMYGSSGNGVMNCTVYNIGANGIMSGWTNVNTAYFINNLVYHCYDVGIDSYGIDTKITGNIIHDCDDDCPYYGAVNSAWGIAIEANGGSTGNYLLIAGNTISNCSTAWGNGGAGVALVGGSPTRVLVSGNTISNVASGQWEGIRCTSISNCIIEFNDITNFQRGIGINSGSNNNVYGNTYHSCSTGFYDGGSGTVTTQPSIVAVTVTSSPQGVGFVTANGVAGYAGSNSISPYTFYATVGSSVTLAANDVPGYSFASWSDGGAQTHTITIPSSDQTYTATYS